MSVNATPIILAFFAFVGAIYIYYLRPYLKAKTEEMKEKGEGEKLLNIKAWVKIAVSAAEMIFTTPGAGKEKLDYVMNYIERILLSKGITMDRDQIRMMVEAAVLELKKDFLD